MEQATPPRKRPPKRHSSTPKVKTSVREPQHTPKNTPFKDASLEEAVFSHPTGRRKKKVITKDNKLSLTQSPKERLTEALNASHYGALEHTLPLTRSLRKSHRCEGIDPKLGYDWIAGILDTSSYISQCSDDYFDELKEFRRANREECCRATSLMSVKFTNLRFFIIAVFSFSNSGVGDMSDNETSTTSPSSKMNAITKQDVNNGRDLHLN